MTTKITKEFLLRAMDAYGATPFHVTDMAVDFIDSILSGKFAYEEEATRAAPNLCAPFPGIDQPWSDEKKSELVAVLKKYKKLEVRDL